VSIRSVRIHAYTNTHSPVPSNKPYTPPRTHTYRVCTPHTRAGYPRGGKGFLVSHSCHSRSALSPPREPVRGAAGSWDRPAMFSKIFQKVACVNRDLPCQNLPLMKRKHRSTPIRGTSASQSSAQRNGTHTLKPTVRHVEEQTTSITSTGQKDTAPRASRCRAQTLQ